jgi:hypothetical protein
VLLRQPSWRQVHSLASWSGAAVTMLNALAIARELLKRVPTTLTFHPAKSTNVGAAKPIALTYVQGVTVLGVHTTAIRRFSSGMTLNYLWSLFDRKCQREAPTERF